MVYLKKKNTDKINPLAAGLVGAAVGAGVAVVASVAMSDANTRKKVGKAVLQVKKQAAEYVKNLDSKKSIVEGKKVVKRLISSPVKSGAAKATKATTSKIKKAAGSNGRKAASV